MFGEAACPSGKLPYFTLVFELPRQTPPTIQSASVFFRVMHPANRIQNFNM
jgi:hypothetical protein